MRDATMSTSTGFQAEMRTVILAAALFLAPRPSLAQTTLLENIDLGGMDYATFEVDAAPELCRKACDGDDRCRSFTYVRPGVQSERARCYLKSGVPKPSANECCISGIKSPELAVQPATPDSAHKRPQTPEARVPDDETSAPRPSTEIDVSKITGVRRVPPPPQPDGDPCDRDRDGLKSYACGGSDCDDADMYRYPGNRERCGGTLPDGRPAADHDEDCNACTVFGSPPDGDDDSDSAIASRCSNPFTGTVEPAGCDLRLVRIYIGGAKVLGQDCDDTRRSIVPGSQVCIPNDPRSVRVCSDTVRFVTLVEWTTLPCPAASDGSEGHCVAQPNGLGVCVY